MTKEEFCKIYEIINKFPELKSFWLTEKDVSGIGSIINLEIETKVNDISGKFIIEISGVESW